MSLDPVFITRAQLERAHQTSIQRFGGTFGIRSEDLIESALAAPINDFLYVNADLFGIAAAYAFHIAQAQAFLDGNKRTAVEAALIFLRGNGVQIHTANTYPLYKDLIAVAERRMSKAELAEKFRRMFGKGSKPRN